ncbi:Uncharacterised protein [Mycobacteroides abscessus subsp. abscessus]|nr:Uncharacterised protein [Mycobacteroides abscessus subsp. abscessus]
MPDLVTECRYAFTLCEFLKYRRIGENMVRYEIERPDNFRGRQMRPHSIDPRVT